jgi:hypothetical protein
MMHRASTGVGLEVRLSMQTTSIIQACILGDESGDEACTVGARRHALQWVLSGPAWTDAGTRIGEPGRAQICASKVSM